jgi:hemolysin III
MLTESPQLRHRYTRGEEIAHSITHGVGAALAVAGLVLLVLRADASGDPWRMVSFSVFGATLVLLYTVSCLYHAMIPRRAKRVFRSLDHAAIYLLIAGTYTPFLLVGLRGGWGWSMFGVIWGLAIIGVVFKSKYAGQYRRASTLLYIGMGWLAVITFKPMLATVSAGGLIWLLAGGIAYTGGSVFYLWKKLPYHHAIWHLFVMAGSACHWIAIYRYLGPVY